MRVVGRELVPPFDGFWAHFWPEIPRYCELRLGVDQSRWRYMEATCLARSPEVCDLGRELVAIIEEVGWGIPQQALEAMVRAKDALGLTVDERVLVIDPSTGRVL